MPRQQLAGSDWVRVRNRLAGICGSDMHLITADGDLRIAPAALPTHGHTYLGHEVVGEVIEIGDTVQRLHVGDRVVLQHGMNCIAAGINPPCRSCMNGNYSLCEQGTFPGSSPTGGGWSEEMLLHEQQLFRVPQGMSDEQAVILEPTAVAVHAVLHRVPEAGERVLIMGAGTIGLLTLQVVRALAPQAEVSVLARYPFQVEKATRMGASHIIYPQDSYREVQRVTQARSYEGPLGNRMLLGGYDVIYDTIGNRRTLNNAMRWTRAKGTIVLVGLHLHFMNLDLSPIWYQEINLTGTMGQGMEMWPLGTSQHCSTFDVTAELVQQGRIQPEQLITHHFALTNYRTALQTAMDKRQGRAIKIVFDYSMQPASVVPNVRASARNIHSAPSSPPFTPDYLLDEPAGEPIPEQPAQPLSPDPLLPIGSVSTVTSRNYQHDISQPVFQPRASESVIVTPLTYIQAELAPEERDNDEGDDTISALPAIKLHNTPSTSVVPSPHSQASIDSEPLLHSPKEQEERALPDEAYTYSNSYTNEHAYAPFPEQEDKQIGQEKNNLYTPDESLSQEILYTSYTARDDNSTVVSEFDTFYAPSEPLPETQEEFDSTGSVADPVQQPTHEQPSNMADRDEQGHQGHTVEMNETNGQQETLQVEDTPIEEEYLVVPAMSKEPEMAGLQGESSIQVESARHSGEKTRGQSDKNRGYNRSKRRKKTHYLVPIQSSEDLNRE
jgi:2-desacetyl-2-hydroxyethyl bacteriochlorophyllide A dehydrogenase